MLIFLSACSQPKPVNCEIRHYSHDVSDTEVVASTARLLESFYSSYNNVQLVRHPSKQNPALTVYSLFLPEDVDMVIETHITACTDHLIYEVFYLDKTGIRCKFSTGFPADNKNLQRKAVHKLVNNLPKTSF